MTASINSIHFGIKAKYNENSWGRFGISKSAYRDNYAFVNYSNIEVKFPEHIKKRITILYNLYTSVSKQFSKIKQS